MGLFGNYKGKDCGINGFVDFELVHISKFIIF